GAEAVSQLVPEARGRLPDVPEPPPLEPVEARFRLFESVHGFLRGASTTHPLVLILDDLHWADIPSLLLLQFLAGELRESRLMVVGAYRDTEVHSGHALTQTLANLAREPVTARFPLGGLGEGGLAGVVENLTGAPPPAPLITALSHATEGNPFFAI